MSKEMMRSLARALGGRMKSVIAQVAREEASRFLRHLRDRWQEGARPQPAPARPALEPPASPPIDVPPAPPETTAPKPLPKAAAPKRSRTRKTAPRRAAAKNAMRSDATVSSVDINTASRADLVALPGIGLSRADAIMNGRPYTDAAELVERRILPKVVFTSLRERLRVD